MRQYSIIVPVLGDQLEFERTLASVLRYLPERSQVLVPCPGDYADPAQIEQLVSLLPGRTLGQVALVDSWRAAAAQATGHLVAMFLPGVELHAEWGDLVGEAFADATVASVAPYMEPEDEKPGSSRLSKRGAAPVFGIGIDTGFARKIVGPRRRGRPAQIDAPGCLAAVFRNEALGWIDLENTGLCDASLEIELGAALKALEYRSVNLSGWRVTCAAERLAGWASEQVSGVVAERLNRRFSSGGKTGLVWRVLGDFVQGRAIAGLGRLRAGGATALDRRFYADLMRNSIDRQRIGHVETGAALVLDRHKAGRAVGSSDAGRRAA